MTRLPIRDYILRMRLIPNDETRPLLILIGMFLVAVLVLLIGWAALAQDSPDEVPTPKDWADYEAKAAKAEAGEEIPLPGESSHAKKCATVEGWCPTVTNGVLAGRQWCIGKKCGISHVNRSQEILEEFRGWIEAYAGGAVPILMAGTIRTESEGKVFGFTKSKTRECGLASVDLAHATLLDVNSCDPEASIWAAGQSRNLQLLNLRAQFPQLVKAPLSDQWMLAGAAGAVGSNRVAGLILESGALSMRDDGTLRYAHPHDRLLDWLVWADKSPKIDLYSWDTRHLMGPNPGKTAFRIARPEAVATLLGALYPDGLPWAEPSLPERPAGILAFPGVTQHCQCYRWPELEAKRP